MTYNKYSYNNLLELAKEIFIRYGYSMDESAKIADVILTADRYGIESHGVNRLWMYPYSIDIGRVKKNARIETIEETAISAVLDAGEGMGHLAGIKGMELAIRKAKENSIGMVTVRNSNHFGIAGYYSMMAAKQGFMGISMTNGEALVVPTFGRRAMMGTNPIAVTIPAQPTYFHMDFATSAVPAGKIEVCAKRGEVLKEGLLVDENGNISTDPNKFIDIRRTKSLGGIMALGGEGMTLGGHKGYGLSVLVEIMTGVFSNGQLSPVIRVPANRDRSSHFFAAIDYGVFGDKKEIEERLSKHLQAIRDSEKAAGHDRIYVHGDKEFESEKRVMEEGVGINEVTFAEIRKYCDKLGINADQYLVQMN